MYKGTIIEDLIRSVERAEKKVREEQFQLQLYDFLVLRRQLSGLEVA